MNSHTPTSTTTAAAVNPPISEPSSVSDTHYPSQHHTSSTPNTGGVVGGVTLILVVLLIALFFWRRSRLQNTPKDHPVNLLMGDEGDGPSDSQMREANPPSFYQPEPFLVPDRTSTGRTSFQGGQPGAEAGAFGAYRDDDEHSNSRRSSEVPPMSIAASSRKSGTLLRPMRPVNIIQHDDAGPSEPDTRADDEPETIELPPAYTHIKK